MATMAQEATPTRSGDGFPGLLSSRSLGDVLGDCGAFESRPNLRYARSCVVDFKRGKSLVIGEYTTYDGNFADDDSDSGEILEREDEYETEDEAPPPNGLSYPNGFYAAPQEGVFAANPYGFNYDMQMMPPQQFWQPQLDAYSYQYPMMMPPPPPVHPMYVAHQQPAPYYAAPAPAPKSPQQMHLVDMLGNIWGIATNHLGSRSLQHALQRGTSAEVEQVVEEIGQQLHRLAMHRFGNFVVQKLFQVSGPKAQLLLINNLKGHVAELLVSLQGSRVVQTVLQVVSDELALQLISELAENVAKIAQDVYGSFAISKCYEKTHAGFIFSEVQADLMPLATHQHGCRVVLALLRHSSSDLTSQMLEAISAEAQTLALHCYGNYVIQEALAQTPAHTVPALLDEVVTLSVNKFGSNVIECCFQYATQEQLKCALSKLMQSREEGGKKYLNTVSTNHYGSYVVQKLMRKISESDRNLVRAALKPAKKAAKA